MKNILLAVLCVGVLRADAQVADTAKTQTTYRDSKPGTYIVPVVLIAYAGASFAIKPVRNVDYYVRARIAQSDPNYSSKVDDYLQIAPGALVYILNLAGDEGAHRFVDRTALLALSGGILTAAAGLKFLAHRVRPYGTDPLSFPSVHTGAAFVAAEF